MSWLPIRAIPWEPHLSMGDNLIVPIPPHRVHFQGSGGYTDDMPTYVYQVVTEDDSEGEVFEVVQRMADAPLTKHPETGVPVRRIPQAPTIPGNWSDHATKQKLSNKNLDRLGFTKYERAGDGNFEKKAGKGPNVINPD